MKYLLYVDDNFHYMDEEERYKSGEFDTLEKALAKAKEIVEKFLLDAFKKGMKADDLFRYYTMYGEDPFIIGGPPESNFSAWDYAKKRCHELCQ